MEIVLGAAVIVLIGVVLILFLRHRKYDATLVVVHSNFEDDYLFLELPKNTESITKKKSVRFKVEHRSNSSQN